MIIVTAQYDHSLTVIDDTDPANITIAGQIRGIGPPYFLGNPGCLGVKGNYAFVGNKFADNDPNPPFAFFSFNVYDISDPANMALVASVDTIAIGNSMNQMIIEGNFAYVADDGGGLLVFDITNPLIPSVAGSFAGTGYHSLVKSGNYVYLTGAAGLTVLDVSDLNNILLVINTLSAATNDIVLATILNGEKVFITIPDSVECWGVANPAAPQLLDTITGAGAPNFLGGFGNFLAIVGTTLYVASSDTDTGVTVLDVSNPSALAFVSTLQNAGALAAVWGHLTIQGNKLYVGCTPGATNLTIVDITNPLALAVLGSFGTLGAPDFLDSITGIVSLSSVAAPTVQTLPATEVS